MSSDWPNVLDVVKSLQAKRKPVVRRWTPDSKIGFALSTRDRFVARGAAMVLFTREAAQHVLENYSRLEMTSQQIRGFYAEQFGVALHIPEWPSAGVGWTDR